ncbi:hypothetical protein LPJ70_002748 [Coemansia sp. RSA 2708]|nr:hypothetical protein LPJ70_002748 [Coemansia sp. RSA 2708]
MLLEAGSVRRLPKRWLAVGHAVAGSTSCQGCFAPNPSVLLSEAELAVWNALSTMPSLSPLKLCDFSVYILPSIDSVCHCLATCGAENDTDRDDLDSTQPPPGTHATRLRTVGIKSLGMPGRELVAVSTVGATAARSKYTVRYRWCHSQNASALRATGSCATNNRNSWSESGGAVTLAIMASNCAS